MFETGAGVTTLLGAVLGLIVGIVVVAQTIYAATVDHIREFGTLKAMGASNGHIYRVILKQAALSAVMGYAMAIVIAESVSRGSDSGSAAILLPPEMAAGMFVVAVVDVRRRIDHVDPQGDHHRSGDGFQGLDRAEGTTENHRWQIRPNSAKLTEGAPRCTRSTGSTSTSPPATC